MPAERPDGACGPPAAFSAWDENPAVCARCRRLRSRHRIADRFWSVALEEELADEHARHPGRYAFDAGSGREIFVIDTPPPYPSGVWHIGAVAQYSMIDALARSQRLLGKEVLFPWGVDRNGINIEFTVERQRQRRMRSFDRAEFLSLCTDTIEEYTVAMRGTARRVAMSCDFDAEYRTDSPAYRAVTQSIFRELFFKGAITEEDRPNFYDPVEGTSLAKAEIERAPRTTRLVTVRWAAEPGGEELLVATTRPELICAAGVIAVHPEDAERAHLVGQRARLPLPAEGRERTVPIVAHHSVERGKGTGLLMVSSYGDEADVRAFRELGLAPFRAIDDDGRMTPLAGPLAGLTVAAARRRAVELLAEQGLAASVDEHPQQVPVSERGKNPVEIILLREWYVRQTGPDGRALPRLRELCDKMDFVAPHSRAQLDEWMGGITIDWPISRRRWYHTEIPIWYSQCGTRVVLPPPGKYVRPWCEPPPPGSAVADRATHRLLGTTDDPALRASLGELRGEEKVFDTWMDSSHSNLYVSGYGSGPALFRRAFPAGGPLPRTLRAQGKEIVRTWLYYTALKSALLLDRPPFRHVWVDGLGQDPWGRKMSKSKGNGIDADSVLHCGCAQARSDKKARCAATEWRLRGPAGEKKVFHARQIGSECFRLWKACQARVGEDFKVDPQDIEQKYFCHLQKIFQVCCFAAQFDARAGPPPALAAADRWILAEYAACGADVRRAYEGLDIFAAANRLKDFATGLFPSQWVEAAKRRLHRGDASAAWAAHHVMRGVLTMLSPVCPLLTHHLHSELYGASPLDAREFPALPARLAALAPGAAGAASEGDALRGLTQPLCEYNSAVWTARQLRKLGKGEPFEAPPHLMPPEELSGFAADLIEMHNLCPDAATNGGCG